MGGKFETRRHPGIIYLASIILTGVLFSGCTQIDLIQSPKQPDPIHLQHHLTTYENQLEKTAFQEAAKTNEKILKLLTSQKPNTTYSQAILLKQTQGVNALLNQILADQAQKKDQAEQINKSKKQLKRNTQSMESLKTLNNNLNQTIQTLEKQKARLEKQIERMKQIDLK